MVEVRRSSFGDFRALSERGRMEVREAAFLLHCERMRNSRGLVFGDAHYSFPPRRLGSVDDEHPDAEHGIRPVMPQSAWSLYQAIAYLDTSPVIVRDRIHQQSVVTPRNYWAKDLNVSEIDEWRLYEKRKLAQSCAARGISFVAVSGDRSPSEIADELLGHVQRVDMTPY